MYEEIEFQHDADAYEKAQDLRWKREMEDATDVVKCPACANVELPKRCDVCYGAGQLIVPTEAELLELCPYCGDLGEDLQEVESRDDEVGYRDVQVMCAACRREIREREAAAEGGLDPRALILLGVDESWMYEGSTAPGKPVARETGTEPKEERGYGD